MWSGPYCELHCHAVCTWKLWNLPLLWFVYKRIPVNLINPRVLRVCTWRCWTRSLLRLDSERISLVCEVILSNSLPKPFTLCAARCYYFSKGKFKLFNSLFHSVYQSLFSIADLFAVVICGSYLTKINAVLWPSARQTFASLDLFTFARIACLLQLWTRLLYLGKAQIIIIFFYLQIFLIKLFLHIQNISINTLNYITTFSNFDSSMVRPN